MLLNGNDVIMCNRCKRGLICSLNRHTRAFQHVDMEDSVHMLLEWIIAELIIKLEPILYRKHIWYNQKGKPMLYVQLIKALYGPLQAALLSSTLQEWILKSIQPVHRKQRNRRKKCTIIWHVDNLKFQKDMEEDVLRQFTTKFGQDGPLTTSRGKSTRLFRDKNWLSQERKCNFFHGVIHQQTT